MRQEGWKGRIWQGEVFQARPPLISNGCGHCLSALTPRGCVISRYHVISHYRSSLVLAQAEDCNPPSTPHTGSGQLWPKDCGQKCHFQSTAHSLLLGWSRNTCYRDTTRWKKPGSLSYHLEGDCPGELPETPQTLHEWEVNFGYSCLQSPTEIWVLLVTSVKPSLTEWYAFSSSNVLNFSGKLSLPNIQTSWSQWGSWLQKSMWPGLAKQSPWFPSPTLTGEGRGPLQPTIIALSLQPKCTNESNQERFWTCRGIARNRHSSSKLGPKRMGIWRCEGPLPGTWKRGQKEESKVKGKKQPSDIIWTWIKPCFKLVLPLDFWITQAHIISSFILYFFV